MICLFKPVKSRTTKTTPVDKAFAQSERIAKIEEVSWSPLTAGPYIVPVTRWVE